MPRKTTWAQNLAILMRQRDVNAGALIAIDGRLIINSPNFPLTPNEAKLLMAAASAVTPAQQRPFRNDFVVAAVWYPHTDYYKEGRSPEGYTFVAQREQQVLAAMRAWKADVILVGVHIPKENDPENSYIPINVVEGTRLARRRLNEREAH